MPRNLHLYCFTLFFLQVLSNKSNSFLQRIRDKRDTKQTILDEPECGNIKRLCGNPNGNDDLLILECIHSLHPNDLATVSEPCQHVIWEHTNRLIKDENIVDTLLPLCRNDLDRLNCKISDGDYFKCLANAKDAIEDRSCQEMVRRMENVAFTDYKFLASFLKQCEKDVEHLQCGKIDSPGMPQIRTISCLQNNILEVSDNCKREVFRLSELQSDNIKLDQQLYLDCAEDYSRYCSQFVAGSGKVFHCLTRQDSQRLSSKCKESLARRERLISQDYKVSKGLMRSCRDDIKRTRCRKQTSGDKTVRLAQILLCLENIVKNGSKISSDCEAELVEHRRMLMEDYRLSPEIVDSCKKEIAVFCNGIETGGTTIHCLMKHAKLKDARGQAFEKKCQSAIEGLIKKSDAGENWKVDPVLHRACSPVVATLCRDVASGEARVMNCLMDNLASDRMTDDCEDALTQIQYFISRRFELDPQLYRACKGDAAKLCDVGKEWDSEADPHVLPCLYRYADREDKDMRLDRACLQNVRRVMRQRAISVDLEPAIEEPCLRDLGAFCRDQIEKGEEMRCLQKNYNDLDDKCRETIALFTELQAERAELNPYINKYCGKIVDSLCGAEAKNDEGDVMECLIAHKNHPAVRANQPCRASIEHFQIVSVGDYRFSYKFKVACKHYAMRFCGSSRSLNEVVRCLSEQVLNATVHGVKSQIPRDCKQQLRAQLFQQRENIDYDPVLKAACLPDIRKFCGQVASGDAQVLECLQSANDKLSEKCEKEVFKVKKQEVYDNTLDYALMTWCADTIEQFCSHREGENVFECLKKNKDEKGFGKKCRLVVTHRIVEQNSNYQLNPSLQRNCNADIGKFCKGPPSGRASGAVVGCLKEQFRLSRLSNRCEKEMADILREQALNIELNPLIRTVCANELGTICRGRDGGGGGGEDDAGGAEECLKDALLGGRIQTPECRVEVANVVEESRADIQVDPLLQQACALDLLNFCGDVPQGNGRHINCLKIVLDGDRRLSPKCKNMLKKRLEMYRNAAQFAPPAPPEDLQQLYRQVVSSPAKQYFFLTIPMILGTIFLVGILCGRLNRRKYMLLKSK